MGELSPKSWEDVVREKCDTRQSLIAPYLGDRDDEHVAVLDIDSATDLTKLFASGELRVYDVVKSYIRRHTNCLTEIFFDDALQDATRLDAYYEKHGKLVGPLHGVPMTLKDQFNVKGADSTIGYVSRAFAPAAADAVFVEIVKSLGAIILAKTNLPQSIMWCETENPMWGLTTNPLNPKFTPGGSTGGEGALLALHGSLIGMGTDIGGSIRIPSHMNGLWGLKPTSSRLSYQGVAVSTDGQEHVPSSIGPMTRSLSSLKVIMQNVLDAKPWMLDPRVTPLPWREDIYHEIQSRPLTIGVLVDDGVVKVHPPIERVLRDLEAKLKAAGHDIVVWDSSHHRECIEIMDLFYTADGGEDIRREVEAGGEPFIPHVEALINRGKPISVYEYWQLNKRKLAAQKAYNDKWNSIKSPISGRTVDILLMPTMPHTAVPHRKCRWVGYTKVWNFLDYTALSFPAGEVIASKDIAPGGYTPRNPYDEWNWAVYDAESMNGHPVGIQIVGRRFEEEKVLGVAAVIERLMKI